MTSTVLTHKDKHIIQDGDNIQTSDGLIISKGIIQIMPSKRKIQFGRDVQSVHVKDNKVF